MKLKIIICIILLHISWGLNQVLAQPLSVVAMDNGCIYNGSNKKFCPAISGGTPPYTIYKCDQWNQCNSPIPGPCDEINPLACTKYHFKVIDAIGDTALSQDYYFELMTTSAYTEYVSQPTACGNGCNGTIAASLSWNLNCWPPIYSPWVDDATIWSDGATGINRYNLCPGTYSYIMYPTTQCGVLYSSPYQSPNIIINAPLYTGIDTVIATTTNALCASNTGKATITAQGGSPPYSYLWSNGNTTNVDSTLAAGIYTVTVSDTNACTKTISFVINTTNNFNFNINQTFDTCGVSCLRIKNLNGVPPYTYLWSNGDTSDSICNITPGLYYNFITDAVGCTAIDTFIVTAPPTYHLYINSTPQCNSVIVNTAYAMQGIPPYNYLWSNGVTTASNMVTTSGYYGVTITDSVGCVIQGTVYADNNYFTVIEGSIFEDINLNCAIDLTENKIEGVVVQCKFSNGNFYFANTDTSGNYKIFVKDTGNCIVSIPNLPAYFTLNCPVFPNTIPLNILALCMVYQNNIFGGTFTQNIDDIAITATVSPARPGFQHILTLTYTNKGTVTHDIDVHVTHDPTLAFLNASPMQSNYVFPNLDFFLSSISPTESRNIVISFAVPANANVGNQISHQITAYANGAFIDADSTDNSALAIQTITAALDPNYKEVQPAGNILQNFNGSLFYTIHFQNTGNDTAFTVQILDSISPFLDANTLKLEASSHDCNFKFLSNESVQFEFNNIQLPDSNINEVKSHGFVKYSIKPKQPIVIGNVIDNRAFIYFDFNQAIITNTTQTKVDSITGSSMSEQLLKEVIRVFPNPTKNLIHFSWQETNSKFVNLTINNAVGENIFSNTIPNNNRYTLNLEGVPGGLYNYCLRFDKAVYYGKIAVMK